MIWIVVHYIAVLACAARVLLRPHRDPTARLAWLAVLFALPVVGSSPTCSSARRASAASGSRG